MKKHLLSTCFLITLSSFATCAYAGNCLFQVYETNRFGFEAPVKGPVFIHRRATTSLTQCVQIAEEELLPKRSEEFNHMIVLFQDNGETVSEATIKYNK